jgi:UDP-3-O-[3-hydroxymyristoyl] glucosamine N-acyltransferase
MKILFPKKKNFISFKEVYNICSLPISTNSKKKIFGIANISNARESDITLFNNINYLNDAKNSNALACIVGKNFTKYLNINVIPIISKKPELDFYRIVNFFYPSSVLDNEYIDTIKVNTHLKKKSFIGKNTLIDKSSALGSNIRIGNNVIIKSNVKIGNGCIIGSNVILENAFIGDNVVIKSGTVIGQTGFGFAYEKKKIFKFPHIGKVIIENNCHIGSLCTIDRGSLSDTIIGEFTMIDNQVQIAHNVKIGNFCIIASQSGIAGSTVIGNNVLIGGQTGISGHLIIGNNVKIGGKSGVVTDIKDNKIVMGYPAKSLREFINQNKK